MMRICISYISYIFNKVVKIYIKLGTSFLQDINLQLTVPDVMTTYFDDTKTVFTEKRLPFTDMSSFDTVAQSDVTPLKGLARWPRHIKCPECRQLSVTKVHRKISSGTQYVLPHRLCFSVTMSM